MRLEWRELEVWLTWTSRALFGGVIAVLFLFAAHDRRRLSLPIAAGLAATALTFYPLLRALRLNQSTLFVALAIGLAWLALQKGAEVAAGAALAIAIAIKPHLVLMVPILAWGSPRAAVSAIATGAALLATSLAYAGYRNHADYVTTVLPTLSAGYAFYPNQSFSAFFVRLLDAPSISRFELAAPSPAARWLSVALAVGTYAFALFVASRARKARAVGPHLLGFAWLAATLATPIAWEHHYAPAIFVFVGWWDAYSRGRDLPQGALPMLALSFIGVASYFEVLAWHGATARLLVSYVLVGGLMLFAASAKLLMGISQLDRQTRRDSKSTSKNPPRLPASL
jgi:hypothetical protein